MSTKQKQETYYIEGRIGVCVGLEVQAKRFHAQIISIEERFGKAA